MRSVQVNAPLHVVMSKCDLIERTELAKRYTMMEAELRALQLRNHAAPHHMISSKTMAGVSLLRASLAMVMPAEVIEPLAQHVVNKQRAAAEETRAADAGAGASTPAARAFAKALAARRKASDEQLKADRSPAERRTEQLVAARDTYARRQKRRDARAARARRDGR